MQPFRSRAFAAGVAVSTFAAAAAIATAAPAFAATADTSQTFSANGTVQTWTVPSGVTRIYVDLAGAQGGASYGGGGGGAELTGTLSVTPGETLNIIAGGVGANGYRYSSGASGGGGSFVYTTADQTGILAAAGGGGGAASNQFPSAASTTTSGTAGHNGGGAGGTDGNGGQASTASGGGGLLTNGGGGNGGQSVASGAAGGGGGGFGGGGGAGSAAGGGGGGYSGGGGGYFGGGDNGGGGGGGSFFAGSLTGAVNNHPGNGFVTIYYPSLLTSTSPSTGIAGDTLTIDGSGLAGATVAIGGVAATVTSSSDTEIVATVPPEAPLVGDRHTVYVTTAGGVTLPAVGAFSYLPVPTVAAVNPASIETGSAPTVTITGTHLTGATAVYFGGTAATSFTVTSDAEITATVPSGLPAGTVDITVVTPMGTSATSAADQLTVADPTITLSPATLANAQEGIAYSGQITADGGTSPYTYSITGGALPDGIALDTASGTLTGTPTADGDFSFTLQATDLYGNSTSSNYSLDVLPPAPTITDLGPISGPASGGTDLTITGTDLTGATAVTIGGTPVASFTVVNPTTIRAVTAPGAAGEGSVTVTTAGGTSPISADLHFTYVAAPTVTAVTPRSGTATAGTSVTITGTGFTGASAVHFGSVPAASFTVNSDTSITAVAPISAAGIVDVTVTTVGGVSATSAADGFTFDPPTITASDAGPAAPVLAKTGTDVQPPLYIALGLLLAGLFAGAIALIERRRREAR